MQLSSSCLNLFVGNPRSGSLGLDDGGVRRCSPSLGQYFWGDVGLRGPEVEQHGLFRVRYM
jgi:hypothetical protein